MSLREAMADLADQMECEVQEWRDSTDVPCLTCTDSVCRSLSGFVRQIRSMLKAAGPEPVAQQAPREPDPMAAVLQRAENAKVARAMEETAQQVRLTEEGYNTAEVIGGPAGGTDECPSSLPIEPRMPVGARLAIAGAAYQLRADRKLHYDEAETLRIKGQLTARVVTTPKIITG